MLISKNKIKQNLYNKGIDSEDISHAISNINSNVEFENAMYLAKKRYERIKNEDKRKIYQNNYWGNRENEQADFYSNWFIFLGHSLPVR